MVKCKHEGIVLEVQKPFRRTVASFRLHCSRNPANYFLVIRRTRASVPDSSFLQLAAAAEWRERIAIWTDI